MQIRKGTIGSVRFLTARAPGLGSDGTLKSRPTPPSGITAIEFYGSKVLPHFQQAA
jgi:hypothetical protein